jgi:hypothetical protein
MFIHTVYFWLKPGLLPAEREAFYAGVHSLGTVPGSVHVWIGKPADTDRPVIDRSYDCGLTLVFTDKAGHDAYQVHPIHLRFVETCHDKWTRVQVYDFET